MSFLENVRSEHLEEKSWGLKYNLFDSPFVCIDVCLVEKGGFSSIHFHNQKMNRFFVISGKLEIYYRTRDEEKKIIIGPEEEKSQFDIFPKIRHQFTALEETVFVEVESVRVLETDIFRETEGGIKDL